MSITRDYDIKARFRLRDWKRICDHCEASDIDPAVLVRMWVVERLNREELNCMAAASQAASAQARGV